MKCICEATPELAHHTVDLEGNKVAYYRCNTCGLHGDYAPDKVLASIKFNEVVANMKHNRELKKRRQPNEV